MNFIQSKLFNHLEVSEDGIVREKDSGQILRPKTQQKSILFPTVKLSTHINGLPVSFMYGAFIEYEMKSYQFFIGCGHTHEQILNRLLNLKPWSVYYLDLDYTNAHSSNLYILYDVNFARGIKNELLKGNLDNVDQILDFC